MAQSILYIHIGHRIELLFIIFTSGLLMCTLKFGASQAPATDCILPLQSSLHLFKPANGDGDWGGFLSRNCSLVAFSRYLYALGERANQTGHIFLSSTEQEDCLTSWESSEGHNFDCRFDRLASGAGGCSDYSVADVVNIFGHHLRSLKQNCESQSFGKESEQPCDACVRSWEDIKGTNSTPVKNESLTVQNDLCRFAVLVSLISRRVADEPFVDTVFSCLGLQNIKSKDNQDHEHKRNKVISTGVWVLIGVVTIIAIVTTFTVILAKRYYKSKPPRKKCAFKDLRLKESGCPKIPAKEVYSATKNLSESNFIGEGTAGKVYKGILSNNQHVAIKQIINDGNADTCIREVTSLSHIRHRNLVALLGYCVKEEGCFLVYELCPNGNLSEWLYGTDRFLSWFQRLGIAIDCARGLWFLHTYPDGCIVHRDIKPTNILLGENFEAKLSDFGLSKVIDLDNTHASSEVRGTFGYIDPEYRSNHRVNSSGDVYSFGIVLLQLLSGKKVINLNQKKPMPLNIMARVLTRGGSVKEFADPKLKGEYSTEAFDRILQLALSCTAYNKSRPSMEDVVLILEEALEISTRGKASTPETTPTP